jgi:dimethylhistidine N-methyltransferase
MLMSNGRLNLSMPSDAAGATRPASLADDVRRGLTASRKHIPCVHLYDAEGSRLFEAICALPEYYPTRTERGILAERADAIVARLERGAALVELGSGSSQKTRWLIEAFLRVQPRLHYLPIDVSREMLASSARELIREYPHIEVDALVADYAVGLRSLPLEREAPKLIVWLGSSIGNLDREQAAAFLRRVAGLMKPADRLLLGIDLRKDPHTLERAYDDAAGVTARFNKNLLTRINRELSGHFDLERFRHRAAYDAALGRVSMHLVSEPAQRVRIDALELDIHFAPGEDIFTESSWKYAPEEIDGLAAVSGFVVEDRYLDAARRFSLSVFALG